MRLRLAPALFLVAAAAAAALAICFWLFSAPGSGGAPDLASTSGRGWMPILAGGLAAIVVSLVGATVLRRLLIDPLEAAIARLRGRASLNRPSAPLPPALMEEVRRLSASIDRAGSELAARLDEAQGRVVEIQDVLESLDEGVLALGADARIIWSNRAARELVGIPGEPESTAVRSLVRNTELRDLLERATSAPPPPTEFELGGRRVLAVVRRLSTGLTVVTLTDMTELRRLEKVRTDFVANASHELKTPLTAMRGFAETLLEERPPPDVEDRFLTSIRDNALRLQYLVDDLLDLSRLESGGWVARGESIAVHASARRCWGDIEERGRANGASFDVVGEAFVTADPQGLTQIFKNLLENAARHSPRGRIRVLVDPGEDEVRITVEDDGEGIPSRDLERIFERFYRADAGRSRDRGGTGLGLAIVRHLVQAMGGSVHAESRLGHGTSIHLTLPPAT